MSELLDYTSRLRKYRILNMLLRNDMVSYQQLSDRFLVSKSSIANDFKWIKKILTIEAIPLKYNNGGTYVIIDEVTAQKIIRQVIAHESFDAEILNIFVPNACFKETKIRVVNFIRKNKLDMMDEYLNSVILAISLLINRARQGFKVKESDYQSIDVGVIDQQFYPMIFELLNTFEGHDIYVFSDVEVQYLSFIIFNSGVRMFISKHSVPPNFKKNVENLIHEVSKYLNVDLCKDAQLFNDLSLHLYQLLLRSLEHVNIHNPLLKQIKSDYKGIYGVVWLSLRNWLADYQFEISEDEIGFITLHFQAALERKAQTNRIVFVCPNGIGVSAFAVSKLRQVLPKDTNLEYVSLTQYETIAKSNIDLIISTVSISESRFPVIIISPLVTKEDLKMIMSFYIDLIVSRENKKNTDKSIEGITLKVISHRYFESQESVIQYIKAFISKENFSDFQAYFQSMMERERLQSTYIGNGIVIPHGDPTLVTKSEIYIFILEEPINWFGNESDIIAFLLINRNNLSALESIMQLIMEGVMDKEMFIKRIEKEGVILE